jgi:hypothetical protein
MGIARLVLDYLAVILSWPATVLALAAFFVIKFGKPLEALMGRIASVKLPGGAELTMSQTARNLQNAGEPTREPEPTPEAQPQTGMTGASDAASAARLRSESEHARLWEYRYLNYFLVPRTQALLTWLAERPPLTVATYDSWWMSVPDPFERKAMLDALRTHHLVQINDALISVTDKGREYLGWRGPLDQFLTRWIGPPPGPPPPGPSPVPYLQGSSGPSTPLPLAAAAAADPPAPNAGPSPSA